MKTYLRLSNHPHKILAFVFLSAVTGCTTPAAKAPTNPSVKIEYKGHGAESVDPKVIAKFAPPPLDPATARFVQNILEVQSPGLGIPSQDGKSLFFTWGITSTAQVWKLDGPMRFPIQLTSGVDRTSISDITPDGKYLILSRDAAGEENPGLYLQSVDGGPLKEIYRKKGVQTRLGFVSIDSQTIFYFANDVKPDSSALYAYRVSTGERELLFSEPGQWFISDASSNELFLLAKATGSLSREIYEWSVREKKLKPVIGQGEKEKYQVKFAPENNEFFVVTDKFGDFNRLYRLKGGKLTALTPESKKSVESIQIDQGRHTLAIGWDEAGSASVEIKNARTLKTLPFPKFENADQVFIGQLSRFGRYATVGVETADRPRTSYVYDLKERKLTQWTRSGLPEINPSLFRRASKEFYPARDGTKIPMLVVRPEKCAADPCPVVVHFHGGPEGQSRPGFSRLAQLYTSAGFIFVDPNVRGSAGYGKAWISSDDGAKRLDVITDIEDCALFIRKNWGKDGREPKIGVFGWSYGGYATFMAMSKFSGAYDAGVALVGMSNLRSFLLNTAPYRRILRISEYGDPEKDKDALEKLSATSYLEKIKSPLMIIQGVSDPRVPAGEAVQMQALLEARGVKAPLILMADEGHGSARRENQVLEIGHTFRFLRENLLGR